MIRIWSNKLDLCIPECIPLDKGMTLYDWFVLDGMPEECDTSSLPISVWINKEQILPGVWNKTAIYPGLAVDIYREPKGTDPFSITFALVFAAKAVLSALMPKIPTAKSSSQGQGKDINDAETKGNKIKINDVIPECAGYNLRYPDYLNPSRRYYVGPREQWIEMLLCVGRGKYQIPVATIKTGETPLLSLGDGASFKIYGPGEYLGGDSAHMCWYSAPEVGTGSTGSSGLELTVTSSLTILATASVFQFNSTTVSIPTGAGSFPAEWTAGLLINIGDTYSYNIADGTGTANRDIITGGNLANLGFVAGDLIEIRGENSGLYEVFSFSTSSGLQLNYSGGAPATGLTGTTATMAIGFRGLRYRIVSFNVQALIVERLKTNGDIDSAWAGWVSNSSNSGQVQLDSSNLEGGWRGPFRATQQKSKVTRLEWDLVCPGGIIKYNDKGSPQKITITSVFRYRDAETQGAWTEISHSETNNTLDAQGFTYAIELPYPMVPECQMRRVVSQQLDTNKKSDTMLWQALRGYIPAASPDYYADCTVMSVRVRGGDRISSQTDNLLNIECTRILPELDGSGKWGLEAPTRKISAWLGHIARSVGYSDSDINMTELQRLEKIWTARGDTYDKIVSDASTVKDNMIECLSAGFAELTIDKGQIRPVRDDVRGPMFKHMYNPQIMREALTTEFTAVDYDDYNGVDVEYTDETTWTNLTVQCRVKNFPGLVDDTGTRVYKMKLEGVHNRNKAYQAGMRERMRQIFQKTQYSFSTEWAALNSSYGDYVALGDNTPGYAKSSVLKSFTTVGDVYLLVSSEPFDWSAPGSHLVAIRRLDGSVSGPFQATRLDDKRLTINKSEFDETGGFYPDFNIASEPPFLQFGPADIWCYPALITEVNPSGTQYCSVKAVNYDVRIYTYDNTLADN